MSPILLHPCYFGPVSQYIYIPKASEVIFENEDNYQKQTYRNRMYVYGANGKLLLNIPVKHTGGKRQHQKCKEVRIENSFNWQNQHWKSLETAYRTSPFFEFYEDEFRPLYEKKTKFLMDFNYRCTELALDCLQLEPEISRTQEYFREPQNMINGRNLVNAKNQLSLPLEAYTQVFQDKHGYIKNLSIVDLIFNLGPAAGTYLQTQEIGLIEIEGGSDGKMI